MRGVVALSGVSNGASSTHGELSASRTAAANFAWDVTSAGAGVLTVQIVAPLMSLPADKLHWFGAVIGGVYGRHMRRKPD